MRFIRARRKATIIAATTLAVVGALCVAPSATAVAGADAAAAIGIVPMAAGVTEAPTQVWAETFENGQGTAPTRLGTYQSAAGTTYTGATYWFDYGNCNGVVLSYLASRSANGNVASFSAPFCTVEVAAVAQMNARRMADVLGQVAAGVSGGTAGAPANGSTSGTQNNHAVAEWTTDGGTGTANQIVMTSSAIGVSATTNRYYTASIDVVEASCSYLSGANNSRINLSLVVSGTETSVTPTAIQACSASGAGYYTSPTPQGAGSNPWDNGGTSVRAGRFTAAGSQLLTPAQLATAQLRVRNQTTASEGNDFGVDNLRLIDVTPSLDKSFAPTSVTAGEVSTLTFTITNTSELAAKADMSFSDALPSGLVVAATPTIGGTCTSTTGSALVRTANAGSSVVTVSGVDFATGATSCTVTVNVTSSTPGVYTNGASNVTTILNSPETATLTVNAPSTLSVRKNIVSRAAASDQFVLRLRSAGSTSDIATATTSGSATGVQTQSIAARQVISGQSYDFSEVMAAGSTSALTNYTSAWECRNGTSVLASGTGSSGTIAIPAATVAGVAVVCTITNSPLLATVTVTKQVQDVTGANPQPGSGWVLGVVPSGTGVTTTPAATTQTTAASGSASWQISFATAASRATVAVSETQKTTHTFVSAQCQVTSLSGVTRTVTFTAATGGSVADIAPGDAVACGFVNRLKATTLTLTASVGSGSALPTAWNLSATGPSGSAAGPTGTTGSTGATNRTVTPATGYQLAAAGGPGTYVAGAWTCADQDGSAVTVTSGGLVSLVAGSAVNCAVTLRTATLTLLKNVVTPSAGFTASTWNVTATPTTLSGVSIPTETRAGAEYSSAGNPASTFEVRPDHTYTLSEALANPSSTIAYRQLALQRLSDGVWVDVESTEITAPAAGQTAVYRFVNDKIPAVVLPLTGGTSTDVFLISGALLLALMAGLAFWQRRRRTRIQHT
ncbi:MAG: LPXTG cell wall anchor domain-containing protein [Microbacterium sp.]|uniref:beta strand repeat-containing protein n=1 Tax=Microbacterium sp. TaxID=51671 RepID=UPI0019B91E63|nr:LPXTG cell wall anchor domain-containing protein [Microbacterium sp.]MBD3758187.1 LPXTG cell wall anchor domain-containing protein [Microbacterium sp.]